MADKKEPRKEDGGAGGMNDAIKRDEVRRAFNNADAMVALYRQWIFKHGKEKARNMIPREYWSMLGLE